MFILGLVLALGGVFSWFQEHGVNLLVESMVVSCLTNPINVRICCGCNVRENGGDCRGTKVLQ